MPRIRSLLSIGGALGLSLLPTSCCSREPIGPDVLIVQGAMAGRYELVVRNMGEVERELGISRKNANTSVSLLRRRHPAGGVLDSSGVAPPGPDEVWTETFDRDEWEEIAMVAIAPTGDVRVDASLHWLSSPLTAPQETMDVLDRAPGKRALDDAWVGSFELRGPETRPIRDGDLVIAYVRWTGMVVLRLYWCNGHRFHVSDAGFASVLRLDAPTQDSGDRASQ